eukprot:1178096-Prorocentrum_minimum.AAC.3
MATCNIFGVTLSVQVLFPSSRKTSAIKATRRLTVQSVAAPGDVPTTLRSNILALTVVVSYGRSSLPEVLGHWDPLRKRLAPFSRYSSMCLVVLLIGLRWVWAKPSHLSIKESESGIEMPLVRTFADVEQRCIGVGTSHAVFPPPPDAHCTPIFPNIQQSTARS